ncbi:MAG: WYL domain-containing protein [Clostridia bacterium]|nr:WYL domain-containing protein [Clostridia bacterium]
MSENSELIKNFEKIRAYMREFYVYGFKSRDEYDTRSARSYDDERRRIESWLGDHTGFVRTPEGKNVFISIDSRVLSHNPFYKAWKAKSFTDGDITLHFILFDILSDTSVSLSIPEIMERIDGEYLADFAEPMVFDESTVRKKLKEYCAEGLTVCEKQGRKTVYRRADSAEGGVNEAFLDYFSEASPVGVIGSFMLDKRERRTESAFTFKHHYITGAMDSDVLADVFSAMREKRSVIATQFGRRKKRERQVLAVPLRVFISVQSGRQYVMSYLPDNDSIESLRLDRMSEVKLSEPVPRFDELRARLDEMQKYMWGVYATRKAFLHISTETVDFTVKAMAGEEFIVNRLYREKRVGTVESLGDGLYRFHAEVFDTREMLTWIRTFICRIVDIKFSNPSVARVFESDLERMYETYGLGEGGESE